MLFTFKKCNIALKQGGRQQQFFSYLAGEKSSKESHQNPKICIMVVRPSITVFHCDKTETIKSFEASFWNSAFLNFSYDLHDVCMYDMSAFTQYDVEIHIHTNI